MEENIIEEKKNKNIVPIVLIVILLFAAAAFGIYKYVIGGAPKNSYIALIENARKAAIKTIDEQTNEAKSADFEMKINATSKNAEISKYTSLLNKMIFKGTIEVDSSKNIMNDDFELFYDGKSILNLGMYLDNSDIYFDLKDLYDKAIKLPLGDFNLNNSKKNTDDLKTIINEMSTILKRNLKSKYFETSTDNITVNGNVIEVNKEVLTLTPKDIEEIRNNVINDIKNDKKLVKALASLSNVSETDIKDNLDEMSKENIQSSDDKLVFELYTNKKSRKLEKLVIKTNDMSISVEEVQESLYKIYLTSGEQTLTIGTMIIKDNTFEIDIDFMEVEFYFQSNTLNDELINASMRVKTEEFTYEFSVARSGKSTSLSYRFKIGNDIDANIYMTMTENDNPVKKKTITNYVNYDKLSETDYASILQKVQSNSNLATLIQDIEALSQ